MPERVDSSEFKVELSPHSRSNGPSSDWRQEICRVNFNLSMASNHDEAFVCFTDIEA